MDALSESNTPVRVDRCIEISLDLEVEALSLLRVVLQLAVKSLNYSPYRAVMYPRALEPHHPYSRQGAQ